MCYFCIHDTHYLYSMLIFLYVYLLYLHSCGKLLPKRSKNKEKCYIIISHIYCAIQLNTAVFKYFLFLTRIPELVPKQKEKSSSFRIGFVLARNKITFIPNLSKFQSCMKKLYNWLLWFFFGHFETQKREKKPFVCVYIVHQIYWMKLKKTCRRKVFF